MHLLPRYNPLNVTYPHNNHPNFTAFNCNSQLLKLPDEYGPIIQDHLKQHCCNKQWLQLKPECLWSYVYIYQTSSQFCKHILSNWKTLLSTRQIGPTMLLIGYISLMTFLIWNRNYDSLTTFIGYLNGVERSYDLSNLPKKSPITQLTSWTLRF